MPRSTRASPSDQAIQSVAVHLIALRTRPLREQTGLERGRFRWFTPPDFTRTVMVAAIAAATTPAARRARRRLHPLGVGGLGAQYEATLAGWYERYVLPVRL
jgi:hypothetical protein